MIDKSKTLKQWTMIISVMTGVGLFLSALGSIILILFGVTNANDIFEYLILLCICMTNLATSVGLVLTAYLMGKNGRQRLSNLLLALFVLNAVYGIYVFLPLFTF